MTDPGNLKDLKMDQPCYRHMPLLHDCNVPAPELSIFYVEFNPHNNPELLKLWYKLLWVTQYFFLISPP